MNINFLNKGNPFNLKLNVLRNPVLVLLSLSLLLFGCGSEDELPGSANPGDTDPLATGTPLLMVQRAIESDMDGIVPDELSDPTRFIGNARLVMKTQANQSAPEDVISDRAYSGNYDVRDLDVSHDGRYVLFSMRAPQLEDTEDEDQPSWNIWEYDTEEDSLRRVMPNTLTAEKGHDIMAAYLPGVEGDIVFSSTRQQKSRAVLLDEGKAGFTAQSEDRQGPTLNLHVMNRAGGDIEQITFNMSHDLYPTVTADGSILYTRWDRFTRDQFSLYKTNPDGTNNQLIYGYHSHDTGNNASEFQFIKPGFLPTGELFVLARPSDSNSYGGDFITIDTDTYIDNTQPTFVTNGSGPAQQSITDSDVETDTDTSPGGYYADYFPLWDGTSRALTSWSQCRLTLNSTTVPCTEENLANPQASAATPAYGVWIVDYTENTQVPVLSSQSGYVYTDIALAAARDMPSIYPGALDGKASAVTLAEMRDAATEEAIVHIRSVYDLDGFIDLDFDGNTTEHTATDYANLANPSITSPDQRPARFLKIVKGVPEPDRDIKNPANGSFGRAGAQRMKEIIGYAPIEPDGSVKVRVPANIPFMISITDAMGKRISPRHQNWITLTPGEVLECKGCHSRNSEQPHGRYTAQADSINLGQPPGFSYLGADPAIVSPFANASMAEAKVDENTGDESLMKLSQNLAFNDPWTEGGSTPDDFLPLRYEDIPAIDAMGSALNINCEPWNGRCRTIIHYEDHIQPLWEFDRTQLADDMLPATCVRCHSRVDDMGAPQIPAGQLELTAQVDGANGIQNRSYVELFFDDIELVDDGMGGVVDCTIEVPVLDADGMPTFDDMDNPITTFVLCDPSETPSMSSNGAYASRFFNVFAPGASHETYITPAELRLIGEWLDIGGQYYNDPFDAPDN